MPPESNRQISRERNENHHPENYFHDVHVFQNPCCKTGLAKKVNRSGALYDPPPPIRTYTVDLGQGKGQPNDLSLGKL